MPGEGQPQRSKRPRPDRPPLGLPRIVAAFSTLCLGIALLVLAVPRTVAAWTELAANPAIDKISYNRTPSRQELFECVAAYERAIQWTRSDLRLTNLASCELALAVAALPDDPERATWFSRAEQHLVQGLIEDPADGFAWTRLAVVRDLRGATGRDVAIALVMAIETAPNIRLLWSSARSALLMAYVGSFKLDELYMVRHQLRIVWSYSPKHRPGLVEAAHRLNRLNVLTWALADDKEAMAEFEMMERQSRFP